ncbi:MAG: IS1634 family transposase [Terriglobales bacterium]
MYLRRCYRRKDGKRHAYWALVESGRLGVRQCAERAGSGWQNELFETTEPEWVEVDLGRVAVERSREFGGPWLGLQIAAKLGRVEFLQAAIRSGREEVAWPVMGLVLVLGRLCRPSSELHLAEHFYEASALAEVLGVPAGKVNEDRLYRALDRLLPHKAALEKHLKECLGELFRLDYDLRLYDVTSTYVEGLAAANPLAQRGYSRDHRPDCKPVNIALVASREGMPLG